MTNRCAAAGGALRRHLLVTNTRTIETKLHFFCNAVMRNQHQQDALRFFFLRVGCTHSSVYYASGPKSSGINSISPTILTRTVGIENEWIPGTQSQLQLRSKGFECFQGFLFFVLSKCQETALTHFW